MHPNLVAQAIAGAAIAMTAALGTYVVMWLITRLINNVRRDRSE